MFHTCCFNWPFFPELVTLTFRNCCSRTFTRWVLFLSSNQQFTALKSYNNAHSNSKILRHTQLANIIKTGQLGKISEPSHHGILTAATKYFTQFSFSEHPTLVHNASRQYYVPDSRIIDSDVCTDSTKCHQYFSM